MREQRPMTSSVGHNVATAAPNGDAMSALIVGAMGVARDIVIGACIAIRTTVSVRNALASQKRMARSSQAPAAAPKAGRDVNVESTAENRAEFVSLRSKPPG